MSARTPPLAPSSSSSSSSLWSCNNQPLTPDSYFFPAPAPAILAPDEFTLQIDVQLDKMVQPHHKPSITHLFPQSPIPSPKDSCLMSGDDISKAQVILRNRGRWENTYDREFESSPPLCSHNAPHVPPLSQDSTGDDFSWEAAHSSLMEFDDLPDPSRCSLLIHEVSLLVGLTADEDHYMSPDNACPLVPAASKQVHDILPLNLTPTKSLASGKRRNAGLPPPTNGNVPIHSSIIPISPSINPTTDNTGQSLYNGGPPSVVSRNLATPISRRRRADVPRPNVSPRRRQGQVFHLDPPLGSALHRNAVNLDKTFCYPRDPPPKPTPNPTANRCSSLDRLESSLLKLQAHAPGSHRKSRSEGPPSIHVAERRDKRPSLPPPRRLKQRRPSHDVAHPHPLRLAHGRRFQSPSPAPKPMPPRQYVAPRASAVALDDDPFEEDLTPGSFMDMDIPQAEEAWQKRRASLRRANSKERVKNLVNVAKRVSRGVIVWGKHLTRSMKLPATAQETTTVQIARV